MSGLRRIVRPVSWYRAVGSAFAVALALVGPAQAQVDVLADPTGVWAVQVSEGDDCGAASTWVLLLSGGTVVHLGGREVSAGLWSPVDGAITLSFATLEMHLIEDDWLMQQDRDDFRGPYTLTPAGRERLSVINADGDKVTLVRCALGGSLTGG